MASYFDCDSWDVSRWRQVTARNKARRDGPEGPFLRGTLRGLGVEQILLQPSWPLHGATYKLCGVNQPGRTFSAG
jgi:hypothetical protein